MSCRTRKLILTLGLTIGMVIHSMGASAADRSTVASTEIDRVTNIQGTTGLFVMNSAYTLRAGELRATAMVTYDNIGAVYSYDSGTGIVTNEGEALILYSPVSVTIGLTDHIEVGILAKTYTIEYDAPVTASDETGAGDAEATIKWNFSTQTANMPALAGLINVIGRTGDEDKPFREVQDFGFKLGIMASSEMTIGEDTPVGFHLEVVAVSIDPNDDTSIKQDKHSYINAGIAVPISDDNLLVGIAEVSSLGNANTSFTGYTQGMISEQTVSTIGVRYTWKYINAGLAASSIDSGVTGVETHRRAIATVGIGF